MRFANEKEFEEALIKRLLKKGWSNGVLKYKTEKELIDNWKQIIFDNNRSIDSLNDVLLSDDEMQQIMDKLTAKPDPFDIHSFIVGKTIMIKRTNQLDKAHYGKEVSLTIFNRAHVQGGTSVYQIAEQPIFRKKDDLSRDRRGDFTLLINGMPVIHVELKNEGTPLSCAVNQIKKYMSEGVFDGLFSLVQIFVVMKPTETRYFANPGRRGQFLEEFQFHWGDCNNLVVNDWEEIAEQLLSIPMAHEMIARYTVADSTDRVLKVLRSYQYWAVSAINKRVAETFKNFKRNDDAFDAKGGYIWHTTGSGKTLTSFKAAQLISDFDEVDKVVFLVDRIDLGTQSLKAYKGFADADEEVVGTEDTTALKTKLTSDNFSDRLIVTSIQKMNILAKRVKNKQANISKLDDKRTVIIVDECHRGTFGEMMPLIKETFNHALYFGFSGTPIQVENMKKGLTTADIFGGELHRYTIAEGIRDGNVLGFDVQPILTFKEDELRREVALRELGCQDEAAALADPYKRTKYLYYMNELAMTDTLDPTTGKKIDGIESYLSKELYTDPRFGHKKNVVKDILEHFLTRSGNRRFHALFATSSINEAIEYYQLFKQELEDSRYPRLNVTAIFDPNIDNNDDCIYKEEGLKEIIGDYNKRFGKVYNLSAAAGFKKDVCSRLAHKEPYSRIAEDKTKEQIIDIVIVVDQLLTGFDSKWINTLYLDKLLKNELIIQAFSRTNRLFDKTEKPHGSIKIYRKPFTMKARMYDALKMYSGGNPPAVFVDKLERNLQNSNAKFQEISDLFKYNGVSNFASFDGFDASEIAKFAELFNVFYQLVTACRAQEMHWDKKDYVYKDGDEERTVTRVYSEEEYLTLLQRYKEIPVEKGDSAILPFNINSAIVAQAAELIDAQFMQSQFTKWLKTISIGVNEKTALDALHSTFARLSQDEQKAAQLIIDDIHKGDLKVSPDQTFRDLLDEYLIKQRDKEITHVSSYLGLPFQLLKEYLLGVSKDNLNEFGRLEYLKKQCDKQVLISNLSKKFPGITEFKASTKLDEIIREYVLTGYCDIDEDE